MTSAQDSMQKPCSCRRMLEARTTSITAVSFLEFKPLSVQPSESSRGWTRWTDARCGHPHLKRRVWCFSRKRGHRLSLRTSTMQNVLLPTCFGDFRFTMESRTSTFLPRWQGPGYDRVRHMCAGRPRKTQTNCQGTCANHSSRWLT